jgi:hypothetical protein
MNVMTILVASSIYAASTVLAAPNPAGSTFSQSCSTGSDGKMRCNTQKNGKAISNAQPMNLMQNMPPMPAMKPMPPMRRF